MIALRTQQILLHESGVANTPDPLAGAYAIESLTNRIEMEANEMLARIDAAGGALTAIETGYIQQHIQDAAYQAQQAVDAGETVVVGVNRFIRDDDSGPDNGSGGFRLDPELEGQQIERVRALRAGRSELEWREALARVGQAAQDGSNLVPPIIAAVEARATLGEVADALRLVFGEYEGVSAS
jgi:methylmalonyl-CoA mutase N-terminal domain/subunit